VRQEGGIATHSAFGPIYTEAAILGELAATEAFVWVRGTQPAIRDPRLDDRRFQRWYELLNVGCRLAILAGTDVQKSADPGLIGGFMPPGACRAYVHVGKSFDRRSLLAGIAAGRTFVTNGPALLLEVNGQLPGSQIKLANPGQVSLAIELAGPVPLGGAVEIIINGKVAQTLQVPADQSALRATINPDIAQSCWIAARYAGANRFPSQALPVAHTSPVYITLAGRPVFDEQAYQQVASRIASDQAIRTSDATEAEKELALDWAHRAKAVLKQRRSTAVPANRD
jgi:hypothetical protein